jgi:hypothetical protein
MTESTTWALASGDRVLLRVPDPECDHFFHIGEVVDADGPRFTARFEGGNLSVAGGETVNIHFRAAGTFLRQTARVHAVSHGAEPAVVLELEAHGTPEEAEERRRPRVCTIDSELIAMCEDESECPVLDVSDTGLAVMASRPHAVGDILTIRLRHGGEEFTGRARVRSTREVWEGRYRYGLYCIFETAEPDSLARGLREIRDDLIDEA